LGGALDARGIPSSENLAASVEGDIEDVNGVLTISKIRLKYTFTVSPELREKAERALAVYAEKCPAYMSVKDCIDCSWEAEIREAG